MFTKDWLPVIEPRITLVLRTEEALDLSKFIKKFSP